MLLMGLNRFDGTTSTRLDDAVGDDRKSSKTINAENAFKYFETDVVVANDEQFALAA